jgi:hypothetical protein
MPPSNGSPALSRAATAVAAPEAKLDVTARAQMSVALQQNVGNARMGAMVGATAVPETASAPAHGSAPVAAPAKREEHDAPRAVKPEAGSAPAAAQKKEAPAGEKGDAAAEAAPSAREAIAPAIAAVHTRASHVRKHAPPARLVASAQAAAIAPKTEQMRGAAVQTVTLLDSAGAEKLRRDAFKQSLRAAIETAMKEPQTEAEAEAVMHGGAKQANAALQGPMAREHEAAAGPLKAATGVEADPSAQHAPPAAALQTDSVGAAPVPVSAASIVPQPLPPERLDYSADRAPADAAMTEAGVTSEQLAKGNEPSFDETLAARSVAERHEAGVEGAYRKSEANVQDGTRKAAQEELAASLGGMHGVRARGIGGVTGEQNATKVKEAQERQRVTDTITGFKTAAKTDVDAILTSMDAEAEKVFATGLERAEQAYDEAFSEAKGGLLTWITTSGDEWKKHIERALATGRRAYMREVDVAIDAVANLVDSKLEVAKKRIAFARKQTEDFVRGLDESVRGFGEEALQKVSADFDAMAGEIDQRRDALVDKLASQYKSSYERMTAKESELRAANQPLWDRVKAATLGVIQQILEFRNMLLGVLAKAAAVVGDIIADPIGFLGNLINGVMTGLRNFTANLDTHLVKGLMDWLFGALGGAGLELPDTLDLKGIISIVLQVLGLTYANFRARAVAIVGEPVVAGLEETADVFRTLIVEGVPGLWRYIQEKLSDLKSMVMDAIVEYIRDRVITAGITWIISLLNPASAFFKACKAIYDIVMFFINRGSQILALVNAVIDSIAAIAKGSIDVAAKAVENALAKAIPVAIGFLAALLNLGDISATIKKTIDKAQEPVNKAIDWVIHQAVKLVKKVGGMFGGKKKADHENDPEKAAKIDAGLAALHIAEKAEAQDGALSAKRIAKIVRRVRKEHRVFSALDAVPSGNGWEYEYHASPGKTEPSLVPRQLEDDEVYILVQEIARVRFGAAASEAEKKSIEGASLIVRKPGESPILTGAEIRQKSAQKTESGHGVKQGTMLKMTMGKESVFAQRSRGIDNYFVMGLGTYPKISDAIERQGWDGGAFHSLVTEELANQTSGKPFIKRFVGLMAVEAAREEIAGVTMPMTMMLLGEGMSPAEAFGGPGYESPYGGGIDPMSQEKAREALRRKNALLAGDEFPTGTKIENRTKEHVQRVVELTYRAVKRDKFESLDQLKVLIMQQLARFDEASGVAI